MGKRRATPIAKLQPTGQIWVARKLVDAATVHAAIKRIENRALREEIEAFLETNESLPSQEAIDLLRDKLREVLVMGV